MKKLFAGLIAMMLTTQAFAWGEVEQKILIGVGGAVVGWVAGKSDQPQQPSYQQPQTVIIQQPQAVYTPPVYMVGGIRVAPGQSVVVERSEPFFGRYYYPSTVGTQGAYCAPGHVLVIRVQSNGYMTTVGCSG